MDVLETYNDCAIKDYESSFQQGTSFYDKEKKMYLIAMRVYCDLQSGVAFKS
eukprot:CAMPEP_0202460098 /NCGR_PEP_ID=MMETSP1360-20130828/41544_1 /ASSEMBLY_ACC=CAM_ASM_000848 /TAXON_ID=515479 /ORGANISM="Licmophora paradoxa, Strain CCMP2313" /LENGTH=51 /DNA_ID=CAMNT_0049081595 /DNA_START=12 /DNA_END=164 /DNA_ORIENTATION=+